MNILLTLLVIAALAYLIMKKNYPIMVLLGTGIVVLLVYTLITGTSVIADGGSGNAIIDVFEYVRVKFAAAFTTHGIVLMPVVGYAAYMNAIGASKLLATEAIRPFRKVKSPYFVIIIAVLLGGILRLAIPSQTGLLALFMVTIYPVMPAASMSNAAAASACVVATAFDWGPACPTTAQVIALSTEQNQTELFINYQMGIFFAGLAVTAILAFVINMVFDKKEKYVIGSDRNLIELKEEEVNNIPKFYAVLPLIPLVLMIICSKAVLGSVQITAFGATMISLVFVVILELIRHKSLKKAFDGTKEQFMGMGKCFGEMICLIASASVFAGGLQMIGGITAISKWLVGAQLPGILMILAVVVMEILMTVVIASNVPSTTTFSPFITSIAKAAGYANESVLLPVELASGLSRSFSPISAAMVFTSSYTKVNAGELIKRNAVPLLGGLLTVILLSVTII